MKPDHFWNFSDITIHTNENRPLKKKMLIFYVFSLIMLKCNCLY